MRASLHFWVDLIGFWVADDRPEDGFAYLDLDGAQVMPETRNSASRQWETGPPEAPLGRGINFEIGVPAVEPILSRLEAAGWPLYIAVEDKWYRAGEVDVGQRQFLMQDPDGYLLRLGTKLGDRPISPQSM